MYIARKWHYPNDSMYISTQETTPQGQSNTTYDAAGRRTSMTVKNLAVGSTTTYTAQPTITYTYDTANRLTGITQAAGSLNNNVAQTITYTYDAGNRRTQTKLANGSTENYSYDIANQLTSIVYKKADGVTLIGDLSYTYDANGRRKSMGGSLARVAAPLATNISTATYDANNRLTKWGGSTATTQSTLSYDNNGNLITDGTYTYSWNARNQLQTVSNTAGGTILANYSYDASGRRTSKAILSGTTTTTTGFTYDGANFVQELNRSGTPTSPNTTNDIRATLITAGVDEALARMTGSGAAAQVLSLATDGNNNTLHTSDQAQTQNTAYTYEAYGRATSTNSTDSNSQQYTGRELDIKSSATAPTNNNPLNSGGLMYYRARYYLPGCARFISEDPIGWASGQTNNYAYVGGNPVSFLDPLGLADHSYTWTTFRCMGDCSKQTMRELLCNPAPGVTPRQPTQTGDVNNVGIGPVNLGPIVTVVSPTTNTIWNLTMPGHMLAPGWVQRDVVVKDGATWVTNTGGGDGPFSTVNDLLSPIVWGGQNPQKLPPIGQPTGPGQPQSCR
jgi:RHS repeat-associated protein